MSVLSFFSRAFRNKWWIQYIIWFCWHISSHIEKTDLTTRIEHSFNKYERECLHYASREKSTDFSAGEMTPLLRATVLEGRVWSTPFLYIYKYTYGHCEMLILLLVCFQIEAKSVFAAEMRSHPNLYHTAHKAVLHGSVRIRQGNHGPREVGVPEKNKFKIVHYGMYVNFPNPQTPQKIRKSLRVIPRKTRQNTQVTDHSTVNNNNSSTERKFYSKSEIWYAKRDINAIQSWALKKHNATGETRWPIRSKVGQSTPEVVATSTDVLSIDLELCGTILGENILTGHIASQ